MSEPTRQFTETTVVADAIKADPAIVDRLIELDPTFRKLKNPALRKVMARLANLGDAARIAGVPLETLLAVANNEAIPERVSPVRDAPESTTRPEWLTDKALTESPRIDVRPMLATGGDPLGEVLRCARTVATGGLLIVEAPFDPRPMRRVLAAKGFVDHAEKLSQDHWRIAFRKEVRDKATASPPVEKRTWNEEGVLHVDVRGLEPPQPMIEILRLIDEGSAGDTLIVHHEREPVFLYPELAERGWSHEILASSPEEVLLQLARENA